MSLLFFAQAVRLPGVPGASAELRVGSGNVSATALHVDKVLEYGDVFVVVAKGLTINIPRTAVLGWVY